MIYVYIIPHKRSNGYCFKGPVPITFHNVDWFDDNLDATEEETIDFIKGKPYFNGVAKGTEFLVLGKRFTRTLVKP